MTDVTGKIKSKGRVDVNIGWWICELLVTDCKKSTPSSRIVGYNATMARLALCNEEEELRRRGWKWSLKIWLVG